MTDTQRHELHTLLMGDEVHPEVRRILEEFCYEDVERIEPWIDDLVRQAELRGRFEALLEMAEKRARSLESFLKGLQSCEEEDYFGTRPSSRI